MGSDLFNHFAQHFRQPSSKMKMEALMILVEHECTVQKRKGRASKAVELTIRICHSVRPIDPSDLVRRTLVAAM